MRRKPRPVKLSSQKWKGIPGYKGFYQVSDLGQVRRVKGGQGARPGLVLKQMTNSAGYRQVELWKNGILKRLLVHRLVLSAFVGKCPEGLEGAHLDGNCKNNKLSNLKWATPTENNQMKIQHGTYYPKSANSKKKRLVKALPRGSVRPSKATKAPKPTPTLPKAKKAAKRLSSRDIVSIMADTLQNDSLGGEFDLPSVLRRYLDKSDPRSKWGLHREFYIPFNRIPFHDANSEVARQIYEFQAFISSSALLTDGIPIKEQDIQMRMCKDCRG